MKLLKRIYYPIMTVLAVLVLVLGFVFSGTARAPKTEFGDAAAKAGIEFAKDYSKNTERNGLSLNGITGARRMLARSFEESALHTSAGILESEAVDIAEVSLDTDGYDVTEDADAKGYAKSVVAVQMSVPNSDTVRAISTNDNRIAYIAKQVQNVIVYIPGTDTLDGSGDADALLMSVRMDAIGPEATAAAVLGAAVAQANRLMQGITAHKNDIVFVFADGGIENSIGLYTFLHQFKGFNGVTDRIRLAVDFDTRGNAGPLTMYQASGEAGKFLAAYNKINGTTQTNAFTNSFLEGSSTAGNAAASAGIPALSFANIGNLRDERTALDNLETDKNGAYVNFSESVVHAHAEMMERIISAFGSADLAAIQQGGETGVYFDYAGMFMAAYPVLVAFLLAGIILGMLAAVILIAVKKKTFSILKVLLGMLIQLLAAGGAALALYLVYFLSSLLLAGFGVITVSAASMFSFINPGIIITAFIVFNALMCAFYVLLKKSFMVKAPDVVRGNIFLTALVAVIVSFALPAVSYMFALLSIMELAVLIVSALFKNKFKDKFGYDIERLFLPVWPVILCIPMFISAISLSMTVTSIVMLPVFALMFSILTGMILPFADYLKGALDKVMKKLPARSVRYEKMVTEKVEDRAKKGKFTTVTSKKIIKEKVAWNYRNSLGITVVTFIAAVAMLMCSSIGVGGFDARIVSNPKTADTYFYDNAFSYVYTNDQGVATTTFEVRDRQAYNFISESITDMKWNSEKQAYEKTASLSGSSLKTPDVPVKSGREVVYETASERGRVVLTVTGAKAADTFTFNSSNNEGEFDAATEYVFYNAGADKLTFVFPYGWNRIIQIKYSGGTGLTFSFEEQTDSVSESSLNLRGISADIEKLLRDYASNNEVNPVINAIFRTVVTV